VIRAAEKYRMQLYQRFFEESGEGFGDQGEPVPQTWIVGNVDECVEQLKTFITDFGITDIVSMAVPPGLRPDQMAFSLEKLFGEVAPRVKREIG
jgi:hypothetical protein